MIKQRNLNASNKDVRNTYYSCKYLCFDLNQGLISNETELRMKNCKLLLNSTKMSFLFDNRVIF